ncbi:MAG: hypothetical protein FJ123_19355 [Deltaproteobacteria bacterium]|nr:hypothetical protein [Deltaproteobacteria bacterium]
MPSKNGKKLVLEKKISNYSKITESAGLKATQEQMARLYQRYHFVKEFAEGKEVLEIGCGAGIGLGYLAQKASKVVEEIFSPGSWKCVVYAIGRK